MTDAALDTAVPAPAPRRLRRDWASRLARELATLFAALLALLAVALVVLDTAPGHRFIADRVGEIETASGLNIRIGRIDGSIFGKSQLRNVRVSDPRGVFLTSDNIELDWAPFAWLYNSLHIDRLSARQVRLQRLPALRPTGRTGPILPGFDIHIGELAIDRLELGAAVMGQPRSGRLRGSADVRAGRAMVELGLAIERGGDRIALRLDAEPDRDRFDLDVRARSPANGLLPAIAGLRRSIDLTVNGDGGWSRWRGRAALDVSGRPAARLALGADDGRYRLAGDVAVAQFLTGKLRRLTGPKLAVRGDARLADRVLSGDLALSSRALRGVGRGGIDLDSGRYRKLRLGVDLLRPAALFPNMRGRNVRLVWTLDGQFARADYAYRLASPSVMFDQTGFLEVRAEGRGRLSAWPMRVPLRLQARAITGVGDVAGAILANARLEGLLTVTPKFIRGEGLRLTSNRLSGKVALLIDLISGRFEVLLSGGMKRYAIPGLGIVDVETDLRVVPAPGGRGSRVVGKARAWVRRLDNSFFRDLTGGLPRLETDLERGPDQILRFSNLQVYSPKLRLSGSGHRNRDGTFHIVASGRQAKYGPLRMTLDGRLERPRIDLLLDRPNESLGLTAVRLLLAPNPAGFDYRAAGGSKLGPFTSAGRILLPDGGRATIAIAALNVAGTRATGNLRSDPGGFTGRLALSGALDGGLAFAPAGDAQRIDAQLAGSNVHIPGVLAARAGSVSGSIVLAEGRTSLDGSLDGRGLELSGLSLSRLTASGQLINGAGQVRAVMAGRRGAAFEATTLADISPDRIGITGRGSIAGRPLQLRQAAILTRSGDGWALAPTAMTFAGGSATLSGRSGARPEVHALLANMPLQVLDVVSPGLGLGGLANGRIDYAWAGNRSGRADLRIRGLSRAGLVLASTPIDVGLAAVVNGDRAAMRAVAASGGQTVGRAQARFAPLGRGNLMTELANAPLFAQLRYSGPAATLWRLSGSEVFDLSGPVAIGADIGGRMVAPQIRGSLRTQNARLESAVTGTVIEGLASEARFSGPRLIFTRLAGRTPGGGALEGRGSVTFSGGRSLLDLNFSARDALLLSRDDVAARVTGPLRIRSSGQGGTISGDLKLDRGRFQLGRASAAASVPQLAVRHTGRDEDEIIETEQLHPWRLDLKLAGGNLDVRGLGINSRWRTDLTIGGAADAPRFTGRADLVRGNYEFAGRTFRLERGVIRFRGESPPDPLLDIRAEAQVQGLDASVLVAGTGLKPEITFASAPALPQDELLSRILFGTSITNLSAPEALQLASAVAALNTGSASLDPINAVRRAVGLDRLRIVPADIATGQRTAISAGKYLGRKLFVEVITDGQGYSATRVEYQVTRWLSLLSSVSTIGRTSANVRVSKDY